VVEKTPARKEPGAFRKQFFSLGILLLLVLWAVLGYDWWGAARKLQWLKSIDFNQIDEYGVLHLESRPDEIGPAARDDSCLALWRSRSLAAHDLDSAQVALAQASGCSQEELVALWAGNLAWLQGKRETAIQDWSQLSDVQLVSLARSYVLKGQLERGRALLECVADRGAEGLPSVRRVQLHQTLGEVYESVGEPEQAAVEYRKAWNLGGNKYEMAFALGKAYRGLGRCEDAIDVFEAGLEDKPASLRPQLDSAYYVELGQCYALLGDGESAQHNYLLAQEVLDLAEAQSPGVEFPTHRQRIEQVLQALELTE
jgi:tetratricopeptide (TPR) repeat protein